MEGSEGKQDWSERDVKLRLRLEKGQSTWPWLWVIYSLLKLPPIGLKYPGLYTLTYQIVKYEFPRKYVPLDDEVFYSWGKPYRNSKLEELPWKLGQQVLP